MRRQHRFNRFHPPHVFGEWYTSNLHLHHGIAAVEMAAHLVLQIFYGLARRIPATADITEYLAHDLAAVVPLGQQAMKRFSGYLGDCVPDRDLDRPDADRALAVPAGFSPLHHDGENLRWIEILVVLVEQQ